MLARVMLFKDKSFLLPLQSNLEKPYSDWKIAGNVLDLGLYFFGECLVLFVLLRFLFKIIHM